MEGGRLVAVNIKLFILANRSRFGWIGVGFQRYSFGLSQIVVITEGSTTSLSSYPISGLFSSSPVQVGKEEPAPQSWITGCSLRVDHTIGGVNCSVNIIAGLAQASF